MNRLCAGLAAALVVLVVTARTETGQSGKDLFERRCSGCHSLDHDKEGPRLAGVYGRAAGSVASFNYSDALKNSHITWDADSLDKWLSGPEKLVPATDMAFHVESASERTAIISYLKGAP
jgi:cytochrome c